MNLYKLHTKPEELYGWNVPMLGYTDEYDSQLTMLNGEYHSFNDKPAVVSDDGSQEWYKNGKSHRDGGPAIILPTNRIEQWYKNDNLHREDGPAVTYFETGRKLWYLNGVKYSKKKWERIIHANK